LGLSLLGAQNDQGRGGLVWDGKLILAKSPPSANCWVRSSFGYFGGSVWFAVKTETEAEDRSTQNWKLKPKTEVHRIGNRSRTEKPKKPTFRFGSARFGLVFGFW
jgi:hypothetical protein